ncbi:MAG: carboxyl transferase domain-containing protein [Thermodesulfobacteriota bacterium]
MSWEKEVKEITRRMEISKQMGGPENVARHHQSGKLTVRERIDQVLDQGSFREIGGLTGSAKYDAQGNLLDFTPANIVIGSGRINQRRVVVSGEDFTIRGGSSESTVSEKWIWAERLAAEMQIPMVRLVDTAGGSVKLLEKAGATKLPGYPNNDSRNLLGLIPVVAAALGSVAGLGAARVVGAHFSVMVKEKSQVFAAGPFVVTPATGENLTKEDLGGYKVHTRGSGVVDNEAESEADAFIQIRTFLSFMPQNAFQLPPREIPTDDPNRREESLLSAIPNDRRKSYNSRKILKAVFDHDSLFEIGRYQGPSIISMFGRLNGYPVGIMASDPNYLGGALTAQAAEKMTRFVDLCDSFHIPIVNFVDQPGVMIGREAEKQGTIRKAIRALEAIEQTQIPWVAILVRKAFGVAGSGYGRQRDLNLRYAWPSGFWGSIPVEGGVQAAYWKEIQAAEDPEARLKELIKYYHDFESPFRTAERFGVQDIIDPRETRPILCDWVEQAYEVLPRQLGPVFRTMRC